MKPGVNLHSMRAAQARFGVLLSSAVLRGVFVVAYAFLLSFGLWLFFGHYSSAVLVLGLAFWFAIPLVWYEWWLQQLPPVKKAETVDDVLASGILGRLPANVTPKQLVELVTQNQGGPFFMVRLGISPNFIRDMSAIEPAATDLVWQEALQLQRDMGAPTISAPILAAALVKVIPGRDSLLAQLQLTFDDVLAAVKWYHYIFEKHFSDERIFTGGIGRDLSFGYANTLEHFADNISTHVTGGLLARELEVRQTVVEQLMQNMSRSGRHNAVLVGPNGVGKTTLVHTFAEQLMGQGSHVPGELRYRQVMALDPSTLIAQAHGRGELEGLLQQLLVETVNAKNIILFLDNAELFFSDGTGAVDVRNVLLPALEAPGLRIIMSMDEQQWLRLSQATPALTQQLNRVSVPALSETDTLLACEDQVVFMEVNNQVTYMYQALKAAYRLGSRYVADQAMPGQALHILEAASQHAQNGLVTAASVEEAVEQLYGVKVATANQDQERQTLLNLEDLLHQRMINQTRAVKAVANALRRARSGVRNPNRPIGSFLFLGPTGVGKTELAKALAAVYFGGEDHLVRVDLNEYSTPDSVQRLIADGAHDPRSLTAQIAKKPFSVVLLDEIEKAHPSVLDTLLQLLDEGILRDITNREVSFRDAVVIATSNAGAELIRQYIDNGQAVEQFEEKFMDQLMQSGKFKPEFLNRFDEATIFRPLTEEELLQVVDLILDSVNKTLAQQQLTVNVDDEAKKLLVHAGYDPRLGARPLRRVVQRTVENIIAKRVLQQQATPGSTITLNAAEVQAALEA